MVLYSEFIYGYQFSENLFPNSWDIKHLQKVQFFKTPCRKVIKSMFTIEESKNCGNCMYWFETSWLFINIKNQKNSNCSRCLIASFLLPSWAPKKGWDLKSGPLTLMAKIWFFLHRTTLKESIYTGRGGHRTYFVVVGTPQNIYKKSLSVGGWVVQARE